MTEENFVTKNKCWNFEDFVLYQTNILYNLHKLFRKTVNNYSPAARVRHWMNFLTLVSEKRL